MEVSEKRIEEIIHSYQPDRRYALAIMQDMQREFQYVPREGMEALAEELQCPVSSLYAMATFYKALSLVPKGKHIIKCCDGTACHIRGASTLIDGIRRELKIGPGETTQDGMFFPGDGQLPGVLCSGPGSGCGRRLLWKGYPGKIKGNYSGSEGRRC